MKLTIIPDLHGKDIWKRIVAKEEDSNEFIFLGDYFDSFDFLNTQISNITDEEMMYKHQYNQTVAEKQVNNFYDILRFKETQDNKAYSGIVTLHIGNHDYHYSDTNDVYSGYQNTIALLLKDTIDRLIAQNVLKLVTMRVVNGTTYMFSHAGVTKNWLNNIKGNSNEKFRTNPDIIEFGKFIDGRNKFSLDPTGDDPFQSPIWIRPKSLLQYGIGNCIQVIGHTRVKEPLVKKFHDVTIVQTDCLDYISKYITIDDNGINYNNL